MKITPEAAISDTEVERIAKAEASEPDQTLQFLLKPLFRALSVFGLYFEPRENENCLKKIFSLRTYAVCSLILIWLNLLRYIPAFIIGVEDNPALHFFRVLIVVWFVLCTFNATILFYGCLKHLPRFGQMWLNLHNSKLYSLLKPMSHRKNCRRRVLIMTVIGCIFVPLNTVCVIFLLFLPHQAAEIFCVTMTNPAPPWPVFKGVFVIVLVFNTAAWALSYSLQLSLCMAIGNELGMVTDVLQESLNDTKTGFIKNLEHIRKLHTEVCHLVDYMDKLMSLWIMNGYITNIPVACFGLYILINAGLEAVPAGIVGFWLFTNISYVVVLSIVASNVMIKAHSPLEYIYDIDVSGATREELGQLNLFLSKLNGPSIGFTAMGLITVTKEVILTLAGLYLTYFFLLLQFKI